MAARARKSHIFERDQHDHYVEEQWCSARLFATEEIAPHGSIILDPCCGWGRVLLSAKAAGFRTYGSDVVDRGPKGADEFRLLNFGGLLLEADYNWWRMAEAIISNPPFDQIEDFAARALALKIPTVAFIFPVRRLPAAHFMHGTPLARLLFMSPRPSMPTGEFIRGGGKVGGGTQDYCWIIWRHNHQGEPTWGWLRRDQ